MEFGNEAFLVATKRFAAIAGQTVLVRLPPTELVEALRIPGARPFVSVGAMGRHGWIQIKLGAATREELERLFTAAHGAAMSHRRSAIKKPSRARHIRSKRPG
jgi:hypothetical protein